MDNLLEIIRSRRSIRLFKETSPTTDEIASVLEAGRWAPSGMNNQPWRFLVIRDGDLKNRIAALTEYGTIINDSACCIAVFYHQPSGYNRDKDLMAIGACIQNMLLEAHALGLGAVWLGEILKNRDKFCGIASVPSGNELMAAIAIGVPDESPAGDRKEISSLMIREDTHEHR